MMISTLFWTIIGLWVFVIFVCVGICAWACYGLFRDWLFDKRYRE